MPHTLPNRALWPPPVEFVQVPSLVEGVELYAPAPEQAPVEETRTFKCPHCGSLTAYNATQQALACAHCGRAQEIIAETVGRRAPEFEFTLETIEQARYGWGEERRELACENCGAVVTVAPDALTDSCAFCGSNRVLARDVTGDILRPTSLVPFSIDRKACQARVTEWLGRGWMHPPELSSVRALREMVGVYLPFWTFDMDARANWHAEVGTERTERYYENGEWKSRTVIDWSWRTGRVRLPVDDHQVPGTAKIARALLDRIAPFDLNGLVEYTPAYLAGWQAELYDVGLEEAWEAARREIRSQVKQLCIQDTGSPHVRNMQVAIDFRDELWRFILAPVYLASYRFDQRSFQVVVNGQTGKVAGHKPVAWLRIWLAIAALLTPGACLGLIGLLTVFTGLGVIGLAIGLILLVAGGIGAVVIFRQAQESEGR